MHPHAPRTTPPLSLSLSVPNAQRRHLSSPHPWDYVVSSDGDDARASTDVEKDVRSVWCYDCGWLGKGRSPPRRAAFVAAARAPDGPSEGVVGLGGGVPPSPAPVGGAAAPAGAPAPGLPRR
jgi:hypothetical protein